MKQSFSLIILLTTLISAGAWAIDDQNPDFDQESEGLQPERHSGFNQDILGVWSGTKNFFLNSTYDPVKRIFLRKKKFFPEPDSSCPMTEKKEPLMVVSDQLEDLCQPWKKHATQHCSCEDLCPNDVRIFNSPFHVESNPNQENSLAFRNLDKDYRDSNNRMTGGYCWGHAAVTQRFNRLAVFSPKVPVNKKSPIFIKETLKKIDQLVNKNQVMQFPGFKDLYELSATEPFGQYIRNKTAKSWAKEAISFQGLGIALNSEPDRPAVIEKRLNQLMLRINQGLAPQLIFTGREMKFFTHAVLATRYRQEGDNTIFCINDNARPPKDNVACKNKMIFHKKEDGTYLITYEPSFISEIGGFRLGQNDDFDAVQQIKSLVRYCRSTVCRL